jgi:hypothetical protein
MGYQVTYGDGNVPVPKGILGWLDAKDDAIVESREAVSLLAQMVKLMKHDPKKYGETRYALNMSNLIEKIKENDTAREALDNAS